MTIIPTVSCRRVAHGGKLVSLHTVDLLAVYMVTAHVDHSSRITLLRDITATVVCRGGGNSPDLEANPNWKVVDELKVPEGLSGDYVVSWRWDCEQTAQVWTQCAIVTIVDPENMLGDGDDNDDDKCETLCKFMCV